jgi:hypothetical protein
MVETLLLADANQASDESRAMLVDALEKALITGRPQRRIFSRNWPKSEPQTGEWR